MGAGSDAAREALRTAPGASGPGTWREAVNTLYGGSTAAAARDQGVSQRSMQRWLAAEEGRSSQSRRPNPARLGGLRERATLDRIARGDAGRARYSFSGALDLQAGGKAGRSGRRSTQTRDTGGLQGLDQGAFQAWAQAVLDGDEDAAEQAISEAMFGGESDYSIPPSPDYAAVVRIFSFELQFLN